ncbi:hypothetical protein L6452_08505 [Arctium lappa]|uniref:Uncharacterized protein n=1 Tax=Arctium lappa TaxID=4217 RepID=A0ACB9DHF9_ARCLA|nr:hypothetical protein L6452_08505 [Arctium lappa]
MEGVRSPEAQPTYIMMEAKVVDLKNNQGFQSCEDQVKVFGQNNSDGPGTRCGPSVKGMPVAASSVSLLQVRFRWRVTYVVGCRVMLLYSSVLQSLLRPCGSPSSFESPLQIHSGASISVKLSASGNDAKILHPIIEEFE